MKTLRETVIEACDQAMVQLIRKVDDMQANFNKMPQLLNFPSQRAAYSRSLEGWHRALELKQMLSGIRPMKEWLEAHYDSVQEVRCAWRWIYMRRDNRLRTYVIRLALKKRLLGSTREAAFYGIKVSRKGKEVDAKFGIYVASTHGGMD
jgi:hypothetical protein